MGGRPSASNPAGALRGALLGPFPALRETALLICRGALVSPSREAQAQALGVTARSWLRIREEFPEIESTERTSENK